MKKKTVRSCEIVVGDLQHFNSKVAAKSRDKDDWYVSGSRELLNLTLPTIFVIGTYKVGKSWLVNRISGFPISKPHDVENTSGFVVSLMAAMHRHYLLVDTEGLYQPTPSLRNELLLDLMFNVVNECCSILLVVIDKLTIVEHKLIQRYVNYFDRSDSTTRLIVVHNLRHIRTKSSFRKCVEQTIVRLYRGQPKNMEGTSFYTQSKKMVHHYVLGHEKKFKKQNKATIDELRMFLLNADALDRGKKFVNGYLRSTRRTLGHYYEGDVSLLLRDTGYGLSLKNRHPLHLKQDEDDYDPFKPETIYIEQRVSFPYLECYVHAFGLIPYNEESYVLVWQYRSSDKDVIVRTRRRDIEMREHVEDTRIELRGSIVTISEVLRETDLSCVAPGILRIRFRLNQTSFDPGSSMGPRSNPVAGGGKVRPKISQMMNPNDEEKAPPSGASCLIVSSNSVAKDPTGMAMVNGADETPPRPSSRPPQRPSPGDDGTTTTARSPTSSSTSSSSSSSKPRSPKSRGSIHPPPPTDANIGSLRRDTLGDAVKKNDGKDAKGSEVSTQSPHLGMRNQAFHERISSSKVSSHRSLSGPIPATTTFQRIRSMEDKRASLGDMRRHRRELDDDDDDFAHDAAHQSIYRTGSVMTHPSPSYQVDGDHLDGPTMYQEAIWYRYGYRKGDRIIAKDSTKASEYFVGAALSGVAGAKGVCALMGIGVEENEEAAVPFLQRACDEGDTFAMAVLGYHFAYSPKFNPKRYSSALFRPSSFHKGIKNFSSIAEHPWEDRLDDGDDVDSTQALDLARGVELLNQSARARDAFGMQNLAMLYLWGHGVPRDAERGLELLQMASAAGSYDAMVHLGWCIVQHEGGLHGVDPSVAFEQFYRAALDGHITAMKLCIMCYKSGIGTKQDKRKAREMLQRMKGRTGSPKSISDDTTAVQHATRTLSSSTASIWTDIPSSHADSAPSKLADERERSLSLALPKLPRNWGSSATKSVLMNEDGMGLDPHDRGEPRPTSRSSLGAPHVWDVLPSSSRAIRKDVTVSDPMELFTKGQNWGSSPTKWAKAGIVDRDRAMLRRRNAGMSLPNAQVTGEDVSFMPISPPSLAPSVDESSSTTMGNCYDGLIRLEKTLFTPDLRLLEAVVRSCSVDPQSCNALLSWSCSVGRAADVAQAFIRSEFNRTTSFSMVFRENSSCATLMLVAIAQSQSARSFVQNVFEPMVVQFKSWFAEGISPDHLMEIDPRMLIPPYIDVEANANRLKAIIEQYVHQMCRHVDDTPQMIRMVCHIIGNEAKARYPGKENACVGGFIFHRVFIPAILSSSFMDSTGSKRVPVLISKVLLSLSNGSSSLGSKEPFLARLNPVIERCAPMVKQFLLQLASPTTTEARDHLLRFGEELHDDGKDVAHAARLCRALEGVERMDAEKDGLDEHNVTNLRLAVEALGQSLPKSLSKSPQSQPRQMKDDNDDDDQEILKELRDLQPQDYGDAARPPHDDAGHISSPKTTTHEGKDLFGQYSYSMNGYESW